MQRNWLLLIICFDSVRYVKGFPKICKILLVVKNKKILICCFHRWATGAFNCDTFHIKSIKSNNNYWKWLRQSQNFSLCAWRGETLVTMNHPDKNEHRILKRSHIFKICNFVFTTLALQEQNYSVLYWWKMIITVIALSKFSFFSTSFGLRNLLRAVSVCAIHWCNAPIDKIRKWLGCL